MPLFLLYDSVVIVLTATITLGRVAWLREKGVREWVLLSTLYYGKLTWALASFPFFVFNVPVIGATLHRSKLTGYDQAGKLVPQLAAAKQKKKIALEERERIRLEREQRLKAGGEGGERARAELHDAEGGAATLIQRIFRGKSSRLGVVDRRGFLSVMSHARAAILSSGAARRGAGGGAAATADGDAQRPAAAGRTRAWRAALSSPRKTSISTSSLERVEGS